MLTIKKNLFIHIIKKILFTLPSMPVSEYGLFQDQLVTFIGSPSCWQVYILLEFETSMQNYAFWIVTFLQ